MPLGATPSTVTNLFLRNIARARRLIATLLAGARGGDLWSFAAAAAYVPSPPRIPPPIPSEPRE